MAVGMPMSSTVSVRFQPMMIERITAGAEMIVPHDNPRDSRNSALVSVRVFTSKRRSRYS